MLDCDLQENMQGGSGVVITIGRKYGSGGKEIGPRLAQRLGISRASLYRAFEALENSTLIVRRGKTILIPDLAALESVL